MNLIKRILRGFGASLFIIAGAPLALLIGLNLITGCESWDKEQWDKEHSCVSLRDFKP